MMMISKAMNDQLNKQIAVEFAAAHKYLAMACAFDAMSLKNLTKRFLEQEEEEREHAMKILKYVQDVGGEVMLDAIPAPPRDYANVQAIVQTALDSELEVTRCIHDLVALAESEKDYSTRSFLQWFVDEQVEEVSSMSDLLALVKLSGDNVLLVDSHVRHAMTPSS